MARTAVPHFCIIRDVIFGQFEGFLMTALTRFTEMRELFEG